MRSFFSKKRESPAEWIEGEDNRMNIGLARVIKYEELKKATNNFDTELGNGGYGRVYLGKLQDGQMVAVKVLSDHNPKRLEQFFNEVTVLPRLRHKNLISLYGCTNPRRQELLLVYEYVSNGTVADHLHKKRTTLTWAMRVQIALETAEALSHLHALNPPIIHRDVKTSNILLDDKFHAKVADFGICRLLPWDSTHVLTAPQGTMGYRDPEYDRYFRLTNKTDVYSFGVVLMELISGQQAVDVDRAIRAHEDLYLVDMAHDRIRNKKLDEFVDPILGYHSNNDVRRMIDSVVVLAINCLQWNGDMRPSMLHIVTVLKSIQTEIHQMQHQDGRQEEIHVKGIQHEKQPLQELRDESLSEVYHGVEEVKTDCKSRAVVKGKEADPIKLCDTVQKKAARKVKLISPLLNPPEKEKKEETKDPPSEVKKKEPKLNTVLLKIRMHCETRAQNLMEQTLKMEGVMSVVTDLSNHQVIVKGFVDPERLVKNIYRRTRKQASIVQEEEKQDEEPEKKEENTEEEKPEKKEENTEEEKQNKGPENKEENIEEEKKVEEQKKKEESTREEKEEENIRENKEPEKKEKNTGEEKKDKEPEKKEKNTGEGKKDEEPEKKEENMKEEKKEEDGIKVDAKILEFRVPRFWDEYVNALEIFSDENPNACSLM